MTGRLSSYLCIMLLSTVVLFSGCDETNRAYFSKLSEPQIQDGLQVFEYKTSTGGGGVECYGGKCTVDYSKWRKPAWPYESAEAEQVRMQWLKSWLDEKGYANANYEIIARERIKDFLSTGERYDVRYEVAVRTGGGAVATTQEPVSSGGALGMFE
jgi:hypothetical protein